MGKCNRRDIVKKSFNSIIKKYFSVELLIELYEISESHTIQNNNKSKKSEIEQSVPTCPPEKEEAIKDALKWFGMI